MSYSFNNHFQVTQMESTCFVKFCDGLNQEALFLSSWNCPYLEWIEATAVSTQLRQPFLSGPVSVKVAGEKVKAQEGWLETGYSWCTARASGPSWFVLMKGIHLLVISFKNILLLSLCVYE